MRGLALLKVRKRPVLKREITWQARFQVHDKHHDGLLVEECCAVSVYFRLAPCALIIVRP